MAAYLLNTHHLSPLVTPNHPLRKQLLRHYRIGDQFGIPVPALTEFLIGIQTLPRAQKNLEGWNQLRGMFAFYSVDEVVAEDAATLHLDLRRSGQQLGVIDALIATIALSYDITLLTTDRDFEAIPTLSVENWFMD